MKKFVLALVAAVFTVSNGVAATKSYSVAETANNVESSNYQVKYGVKLGGVASQLQAGGVLETVSKVIGLDWNTKLGCAAGIFAEVPLANNFAIQPEVLYVQKGARPSVNAKTAGYALAIDLNTPAAVDALENLDAHVDLSMDYIEIPILFKAQLLTPKSKIRPTIFAGPEFSVLVKSQLSVLGGLITYDTKDLVKSTDFGLVFGVGVEAGKFSVDIRYDLGLTNTFDKSVVSSWLGDFGVSKYDYILDDCKLKNSAFMATIGYAFN